LEAGLLVQQGGWVAYGAARLGQSWQAARRRLRENPELAARLDRELHDQLLATTEQPVVQPAAS
jgi:recombination protein RecA